MAQFKHDDVGATALPKYGAYITEDNHRLFGDVSGKKLLEIGCGSGESLKYHGDRKAFELWGMDISENQIAKSNQLLTENGLSAKFICSPMEEECGIPENYFDFVYSIYAIGWTTDLVKTFCRIASYLKKDGVFIFSWSHPIHKCVSAENDMFVFKKSYFDESRYSMVFNDGTLTLSDYRMSTYVNALYKAGFIIEQMIEEPDDDLISDTNSDHARKAKMIPATFVIKARKL
ncbi:MAG TPA: class I SAM-dependent methyltransferase [Bacteroidales bacterium]|nr:class I SAM-dependent methyltransferase [Bacteroidales bacterium]